MLVLALETSGRQGSVALARAEDARGPLRTVAQTPVPRQPGTAAALLPAVERLLGECRVPPRDIGLLAVVQGPGSFTGLRIGVTAAKTLAYAIGCPLVAVDALAAIAGGIAPQPPRLWTVLDAQRSELYAALFAGPTRLSTPSCATRLLTVDAWLAELQAGDRVAGPPLGTLQPRLPAGVEPVLPGLWAPQAEVVGRLGWEAWQAGATLSPFDLVPAYYRRSAAEEKAAARGDGPAT